MEIKKFDPEFSMIFVSIDTMTSIDICDDGEVDIEIQDRSGCYHHSYTDIETLRQIVSNFDKWMEERNVLGF